MEKREKHSKIILIFFTLFTIFFFIQIIAPMSIPYGEIKDLSGSTIISDNIEKIKSIQTPWNYLYSLGDSMCHQKSERSFFINGNQMPFCSRCTAIILGIALGIGFMFFYKFELDDRFIFIMLIGFIPIGIDGVGQLFGFWESTNLIRVITGLLVGIVTGIAIGIIIDEVSAIQLKKAKSN